MLLVAFAGAAARRRAGSETVKLRAAETGLRERGRRAGCWNARRKTSRVARRARAAARARSTRSGARGPSNKIADECLILRSRSRTTKPRWHVSVLGRGAAGDDQHPTNTQTNSRLRGSLGKGRSHRTSCDERDRAQAKRQSKTLGRRGNAPGSKPVNHRAHRHGEARQRTRLKNRAKSLRALCEYRRRRCKFR